MTNILIEELPTSITIADVEYKVDTDFRNCLKIIMAMEDDNLAPSEKQWILLNNIYAEEVPEDLEQAYQQAVIFLDGSASSSKSRKPSDSDRLFSFSKDANYIYAAFNQTHRIDLNEASMHWHKFIALFMDLGQDTTFCQLVAFRKRIKSGKATKEEIQMAHEMEDIFEVDELSQQEEEAIAKLEAIIAQQTESVRNATNKSES